ncbi:hypothetical protein LWI28_015735 [Acer negundo]|uniref:Peptidase A1 domain-containing protein n=1 Tax=Acer negundo TaxID=4023 RepID=A0AAD5JNU0_ACENE|nr:hypothetical protein LWI28_015735 [Acer negundo]
MASSTFIKSIILFMLVLVSLCQAQKSASKPKAGLLPVSKDPSTLQYITRLNIGTPSVPKTLVVDLGGRYTWIDCTNGYNSSTYKPGICGSAPCSLAKSSGACTRDKINICYLIPENTVTGNIDLFGEVAMDKISLQSTDGSKPGPLNSVPDFIFSCARDHKLVFDLARGAKGMLALGRNSVGLPTQLASFFGGGLRRKFAICLPSKPKTNGVIFLGDSPYIFYRSYNESKTIDVSSRFTYTKLYINPVSTAGAYTRGEQSTEYFVGVNSITVERKPIRINSTLLSINNKGFGGTKLSTVRPYTVVESSIYRALVKAFDEAIIPVWNVSKVKPVKPFNDCYTVGNMGMTPLGIGAPDIAFVFENNVKWEIYGANSMVEISHNVYCLGFLDGGSRPRTSIVIGAHQLEDNLLQFDLAASKLAFSQTLILGAIECSNFKF